MSKKTQNMGGVPSALPPIKRVTSKNTLWVAGDFISTLIFQSQDPALTSGTRAEDSDGELDWRARRQVEPSKASERLTPSHWIRRCGAQVASNTGQKQRGPLETSPYGFGGFTTGERQSHA